MRVCTVCGGRYGDDVSSCPDDGAKTLPEAQAPVDPLIGRTVGSYRIEKLIGKGGMSIVYQAVHPAIGSKVAVKFLRDQFATDHTIVSRFFNEAKAVNVINHDNIVRILDFNLLDGNKPFFVMELLGQGLELSKLARRPLSLEVAGPIVLQVCDALAAAHAQGVVHRDLKPDNIFLSERSGRKHVVKLMDFGIAKLIGGDQRHTSAGMVIGTPNYMSPEQASGKVVAVDGRSDIYSLGVVMFQLATGRVPFVGDSYAETLVKHLTVLPPRPRDLNPNIEPAYERIILKCLAKDPLERFQTARALEEELGGLLASLGLSIDPPRIAAAAARSPAPTPAARPLPTTPPPAPASAPRPRVPAVAAIGPAAENGTGPGLQKSPRAEARQPANGTAPVEQPASSPAAAALVNGSPLAEPSGRPTPSPKKPALSDEPAWATEKTGEKKRDVLAREFSEERWAGEPPSPRRAPAEMKGRKSKAPWVVLALVLAGAAGAGGYYLLRPAPASPAAKEAFDQGRRLTFADVRAQFPQAQAAYEKALALSPDDAAQADALLAELHAAWSESLTEEADALGRLKPSAGQGAARTTTIAADRAQAATQAQETCRSAKAAQLAAPAAPATFRALLACARVTHDQALGSQEAAALSPYARDPETEADLAAWDFQKSPPDLKRAEALLTEAAAALPTFVRAHLWLARVQEAEGNEQAARVELQAILQTSPQDESAHVMLEAVDGTKPAPRPEKTPLPPPAPPVATKPATPSGSPPPPSVPATTAAAHLQPASSPTKPVAPPKAAAPGKANRRQKKAKPESVSELVARADRLAPRSSTAALKLYDEALNVDPKNIEALFGRGKALFNLGQVDQAIAALKKTLALSPEFAEAMYVLGESYQIEGAKPQAIRWYKKYLDARPDGEQARAAARALEALQ